jgi:HTH-type transcriptional regulator/antitoxin HigA
MKTRTRAPNLAANRDDRYLALVRRFPLRQIRSKTSYVDANRIHHELLLRNLDQDEADYALMLGRLIREYDESHSSLLLNRRKTTPIEILKFLMEQHRMNTTHLGDLVGGRGQASLILSGKRELSKANIRKLAEHFHVSPAMFL